MKLLDATLQVGVPIANVAEWCRLNGVQPRTFYRHRARVAAEGAWSERSRRPHSSPTATPDWLVARIVALRAELARTTARTTSTPPCSTPPARASGRAGWRCRRGRGSTG